MKKSEGKEKSVFLRGKPVEEDFPNYRILTFKVECIIRFSSTAQEPQGPLANGRVEISQLQMNITAKCKSLLAVDRLEMDFEKPFNQARTEIYFIV